MRPALEIEGCHSSTAAPGTPSYAPFGQGLTEHFFHSTGQGDPRKLIAILMGVAENAKKIAFIVNGLANNSVAQRLPDSAPYCAGVTETSVASSATLTNSPSALPPTSMTLIIGCTSSSRDGI